MKTKIESVAESLGLSGEDWIAYGPGMAKISPGVIESAASASLKGRLVLVTAMTPTPAGEGKTTTAIGLADGLRLCGVRAAVCLRQPSLGPVFGMKGGATGGGRSSLEPGPLINLHFTGDFHAIGAAHNLLSALVDNALHWGTTAKSPSPSIDPRRLTWPRVTDTNDRALRKVVCGLGGPAHGMPRESRFDITAASEVMAAFCLADDFDDLQTRLSRMVVGYCTSGEPVRASDIGGIGALGALLLQAFLPNLVRTAENTPALVHGGPFANIAHGCNSVVATKTALHLADVVVTEAGFGADLGAEKFVHIKCRSAGLSPAVAVVVATLRALKMHGGVSVGDASKPQLSAALCGLANLHRHLAILQKLSIPAVVALNAFADDDALELETVCQALNGDGHRAVITKHHANGGQGARELAETVMEFLNRTAAAGPPTYKAHGNVLTSISRRFIYEIEDGIEVKARKIAQQLYGADDIALDAAAAQQLRTLEAHGYGNLAVCIAKTPYSFTADPSKRGAPHGFLLPIREARLSAGAGFVVLLTGDLTTMPGLPRRPAAMDIQVNVDRRITGV